MDRKTIVIDSRTFNDLEGFYTEVDRLLTKNYHGKQGIILMH